MERRKHITFTVTNDLVTDQRMIRICNTLQLNGFDVLLVGRIKKSSPALCDQHYAQHRIRCWFSKGMLFYAEYNIRLLFFLMLIRTDIISAVDADTLLPCTVSAKFRKKKLAFDAHEYFTEVPELKNRDFVRNIWQQILNICIPLTDLAYTVGPGLALIFTAQYQRRFDVIYNMPVKKETGSVTKQKPPVILYQGDLNKGRGLEETITAMSETDAVLHIAGDGPIRKELEQLSEYLGLEHKVTFLGRIEPKELHSLTQYATAGINVLDPSSASYRYSIANKFFDYVQAHVPVICADLTEYRVLNRQYEVALLCDYSSKAIAASIRLLLSDDSLYKKLGDNCRQAAGEWCWETQEKNLVGLYNTIIK